MSDSENTEINETTPEAAVSVAAVVESVPPVESVVEPDQLSAGTPARGAAGPDLSEGSDSRRAVRRLQQLLNKNGFEVSVTGEFDADTTDAVVAFQEAHKLSGDGIVGSETWDALLT